MYYIVAFHWDHPAIPSDLSILCSIRRDKISSKERVRVDNTPRGETLWTTRKTCFIVMPFRKKPVDGQEMILTLSTNRCFLPAISHVTLPEGGKLEARRTDQDFFTGDITVEMFRYLEYSRFVLADITSILRRPVATPPVLSPRICFTGWSGSRVSPSAGNRRRRATVRHEQSQIRPIFSRIGK
jgi:hypothetical protein